MANEAHKEPTMEEILASIRKIIADDTPAGTASPVGTLQEVSQETAPLPTHFDNDDSDLGMFEANDVEFEPTPSDAFTPGLKEEIVGPEFTFEEITSVSIDQIAPLPVSKPAERADPAATPAPAAETTAKTAPSVEPHMSAAPRFNAPLIEEKVAESAAGALGKLISKMDITSENTLEGLVRELVRPMIKEWLDDNLARIVEEKVEAEVQRIARMAR